MRTSHTILLYLCLIVIFIATPYWVVAIEMESKRFKLESEITILEENSSSVQLLSLSAEQQKSFEKNGFAIISTHATPFGQAIETSSISFKPNGKAQLLNNNVNIQSQTGYQVSLYQEKQLSSFSGEEFPNTACDTKCSYLNAAPWKKKEVIGLGYTLNGESVPEDFINTTYFRTLADSSKNQSPAPIHTNLGRNSKSNVSIQFKLNPEPNDNNVYKSNIIIQAFPSY